MASDSSTPRPDAVKVAKKAVTKVEPDRAAVQNLENDLLKIPLQAKRRIKKPKPAEDGNFQNHLMADLLGAGFIIAAAEATERVDSAQTGGVEPLQPTLSPDAKIGQPRRFVPR